MYAAAGNHPHTTNEILGFNPNLFDTNEDDETAYSLAVKNCSNLALAVLDNFLINLVCWIVFIKKCILVLNNYNLRAGKIF